jgi:hypothetical protein
MKHTNLLAIGLSTLLTLSLPLHQAGAMGPSGGPTNATPTSAGDHPGKSVEKKLAKLTAALNLTAEEQAKIIPILEQEAAQVKALHADQTLSKTDHAAKLKQVHADTKLKIAAVLNADQQKKFADMGPGHRSSAMKNG